MSHEVTRHPGAHGTAAPLGDDTAQDIRIRAVASLAEFRACVGLQVEVWGPEYTDSVPASLLQVSTYVGGLVLGAFTPADELVGFLFGLTGMDGPDVVHWSHLLGVRPGARDLGVGRMLKEAQRATLAARGVRRMSWTFDPLVAKNAYLNFNRLGAYVVEYVADMYGTTTSPLHYGLATDRLVVCVDTDTPAHVPAATEFGEERLPVLTLELREGDLAVSSRNPPPSLWIEIPNDIHQVIERAPTSAVAWRKVVRDHFQWALAAGYAVLGLHRDAATSRSYYVLRRQGA
ncbi:MAG: hypothetical protein ABJE47_13070 [bacterium]